MAGGGFCDGVSLPVQMDLAVCHFLCNSRKSVLLFFSNTSVTTSCSQFRQEKKTILVMGFHAGLHHVVLNVIYVPSGLLNKILYEGGILPPPRGSAPRLLYTTRLVEIPLLHT